MPRLFYSLERGAGRGREELGSIGFCAREALPDALVRGYSGKSSDLVQLPFLDTKCVSEEYVRRVAAIFQDVMGRASEKRYKELVLNGSIVGKVMKYIEGYLNNKKELSIDALYLHVVEDLYQSAYNYCILHYHEQMQAEFEDERPKALEHLLDIF
jgi:hypothetical protein